MWWHTEDIVETLTTAIKERIKLKDATFIFYSVYKACLFNYSFSYFERKKKHHFEVY